MIKLKAKKINKQSKKLSGKSLRTMYYTDEPFYGMSDTCTGQIEINIEFIWKLCKRNEDKFIRIFGLTYTHEYVHTIVSDIVEDLYTCGEEKFIRKMLGEEWNKEMEKYYECIPPSKSFVIHKKQKIKKKTRKKK
ncbi:hypothetical protein HZA99_06960 [Candidatus Woesearchaeota archaeon]|nr:hypothetical protein [Candidatus Woesearchaeota archaeon]